MNPVAPPTPVRRIHLLCVAAIVWLTLISLDVIVDHVALSHVLHSAQQNAQAAEIQTLRHRLDGLEPQLAHIRHQPQSVSQTDWTTARQALDVRLGKIAQALDDRPTSEELTRLQARVDQVESRLAAHPQTPAPSHTRHRPIPPSPPVAPPFGLLGRELRGGETFLSLAPSGTSSLSQVQLLRLGGAVDGWQLVSLDARTATFQVNGQVRTLPLPAARP